MAVQPPKPKKRLGLSGGGSPQGLGALLGFVLGQEKERGKEERGLTRKATEVAIGARKETEQQKQQAFVNFERVKTLLGKNVAQQKARFEEQSKIPAPTFGLKGFDVGGPIKGRLGTAAGGLKLPGFERTATTEGQRTETALALNNILTGQNRAIKSIIERITRTLPGDNETPQSMTEKIAQTVRNSFGLLKSLEKAGFDQRFFEGISDVDASDVNSQVNQVLSQLPIEELEMEEEQAAQKITQDIISTPAAQLTDPETGLLSQSDDVEDRKNELRERFLKGF